MGWLYLCLAVGALVAALAGAAFGEGDRPPPTVSWAASEVAPGSPVMIEVRAATDLETAEAFTGSERFVLARAGEGIYRALVGIDLAWKDASFPVDLELTAKRGEEPLKMRADLFVRQKQFGQQALSLPSHMVDLSDRDADRVKGESALLRDTVARRTEDLFWSAGFAEPLTGRVSTPFGSARTMNGKSRAPHSGVDIASPSGQPVRAAAEGVVALTEEMFFSGRTVVLDHGSGILTLYAHLDRVDVEAGQAVRCGDVLGAVGSTGRATGPHLHFAAFIRGARVDPLALIRTISAPSGPSQPQSAAPSAPTRSPAPS